MPLIGAHVSAAGGLHTVFERATTIGAQALQMFGASPRQWNVPLPSPEAVALFKAEWKKSAVREVYLHAPYLINIAHPEDDLWQKSVQALTGHFQIATALGAQGLIFHIGSSKHLSSDEAIKKITRAMKKILAAVSGKTFLMVENSAGEGQKVGSTPEEIGTIIEHVKSPRVKVCIDTAHTFESGLIEAYTTPNIKIFFSRCDKAFGAGTIQALHINDSKTAGNSHHDRHENIGKGYIGLQGFVELAKEKRFAKTAWLLEVPGFAGLGPDKENVDILKKCLAQ